MFNYLVEKRRMLDSLGRTDRDCCGVHCNDCPLSGKNTGMNVTCYMLEMEYPMMAIAIVGKWLEEHPHKTYKDELLEKYPNASIGDDNLPVLCIRALGVEERVCDNVCSKCWNMGVRNED